MIITHKVNLDLMEPGTMPKINAVQSDRYTRKLEITLYSDGAVWEVPEETSVFVRYTKADGTAGEYNTLPDGSDAWIADGNVLTVMLAPQVLTVPGMVRLSVSLISGEEVLTTFAVGINVKPAAAAFTADSEDYVNILTVGSVEALEATEAPAARITGTVEHPVLHLGIPCGDILDAPRVVTMEEVTGGYWDTKEVWNEAEGIWVVRTNLIPVQSGEAFLYTGVGVDNVPSALWFDAAGNILSFEQYDVEDGVRAITVPVNAESVRFYSHSYDGSGTVILNVVHLPKGDNRKVSIESKENGYWNTTGEWVETIGGAKRTNPILVSRDDRFCYIGYGRWSTVSVLWYDADGGIVSYGQYCEEVNNRAISVTIFPPDGAVYARFFSYCDEGADKAVLGISIETESDQLTRFKQSNVLYGKKYVACGDSFTAGDFTNADGTEEVWDEVLQSNKTYPWWIASRNCMTLVNEAVCGTTMYAGGGDNAFSAGRYTEVPKDADYITLCFGLNETNAELGTLEDTTNATVLGAWNVVLEYLITNMPYAKIGIILPDAWCTEEMRDAIVSVAEYWGVPYLDLKGDPKVPLMIGGRYTAVNEKAVALRNSAFQMTDGDSHPNLKAHEYRSTVIENFLRSL